MSAALNIFYDMANKKIPNICQSKMKESKSTFIWMIHNFSDRRQNELDVLKSGIFTSISTSGDLVKWSLQLKRSLDSFVISITPTFYTASNEVSAKIKFMFRNSKGEEVTKLIIPNRIFFNRDYYKPPDNLIKRAELFDENNGFLPGDRLIIVFQVTIFEETLEMECGIVDEFEIPECNAVEEGMGNLLGDGLFTDCTLVAEDGTKFEVHKNILACRSPVFRAMFEHKMVEAKEGIANIKDIKSPVLEQMIQFMYNGKAPKLGEMAEELLQAAEMYQLDRLKMLCERELIKSLRNENVLKRLALANKHSAKNLKTFAIKYVQMNAKEVMESDEWKMLIDGFGDVGNVHGGVFKILTSVAGTVAFSFIVYLVYNRITKGI